jgi:hypothetical protein
MTYRHLLIVAITCLVLSYAQAQTYVILARAPKTDWKYYNLQGEVIIDKRYALYYPFTEDGLAIAGKGNFVVLDRTGNLLNTEVPVRLYDDHNYYKAYFSDGLLVTLHEGKFGCIDTGGRIAIRHKYYELTEFMGGYAIARIKRSFFVVDKKGQEFSFKDSTAARFKPFHENRAAYMNKKDKWGFVDTEGNVAVAPQFNGVGNFHKGLAWARNEAGLIGYINPAGDWVIKPGFSAVKDFDAESGLALVKESTWMYINTSGEVHPFKEEAKVSFSEGLVAVKKDGKFGYMNAGSEWICKPQFDSAWEFENGFAWVKQDGLWGVIDKQGAVVLKPQFEAVKGNVVKLK